jgi:peptidoglycan/LPS O-acetylase OafA/YrhL
MCTLGFTCLALFYASLLMQILISPHGLASRVFQMSWLRWLGKISYGLYLFHFIVMAGLSPILVYGRHPEPDWLLAMITAGGAAGSIALSWLSWTFFESKIVRFGHRFTYRNPAESVSPLPRSALPAE